MPTDLHPLVRAFHPGPSARQAVLTVLTLISICCVACGPQTTQVEKVLDPSVQRGADNSRPSGDADLQYVKKGGFARIYVISRRDNGPLQSEDKVYLRENTPTQTNMWVISADNRRAIAGTNFEFTPEQINALEKRFSIESIAGRSDR